jgi:hypothetical protein
MNEELVNRSENGLSSRFSQQAEHVGPPESACMASFFSFLMLVFVLSFVGLVFHGS